MNRWQSFLWIALLALAAACRPAPAASPTAPAATEAEPSAAPATAAPGELVKFSGETEAASDPFYLEVEEPVKVAWDYSGAGPFALWLVNDTETLEDPALVRVLIKEAAGPSQESAQYTLSPGDYHLEVELAGGPWTVVVTALR